jgi:DNA modification methylase
MTTDPRTLPASTPLILTGNANRLALPDGSVDLIVTSPPYFALRDYKDTDGSLKDQIGAEATPAEFLEALWACSAEWWRVLAPGGSLWVNLGDKWAQSGTPSARSKSLLGLPWRYAIGMTDGQGDPDGVGWILRAEVIWDKPNGLPESVRDRVGRKHEQWFHFTKQERYYAATDRIREPYSKPHGGLGTGPYEGRTDSAKSTLRTGQENLLGKLPGSVWSVATEPLKLPPELKTQHFAAFPSEWPRRIILGWSPETVCLDCGQGLVPVVQREKADDPHPSRLTRQRASATANGGQPAKVNVRTTITGEACGCDTYGPHRTRPGVVLDPFGGTGTTAAVAVALDRVGVTNDLSKAYTKIAKWRVADPKLRAKVRKRSGLTDEPTLLIG